MRDVKPNLLSSNNIRSLSRASSFPRHASTDDVWVAHIVLWTAFLVVVSSFEPNLFSDVSVVGLGFEILGVIQYFNRSLKSRMLW